MEMIPSFKETQLKEFINDLIKLDIDYKAVAERKRRESNPVEKNNLQLQLDDIGKEIQKIEQQKKRLEEEAEGNKIKELQEILSKIITKEEILIVNRAHRSCSPEGWHYFPTDDDEPENILKDVMKMPQGGSKYKKYEHFVACLIVLTENESLIYRLKKWAEDYIEKFDYLLNIKKEKLEKRSKNTKSYLMMVLKKSNQASSSNNSDSYHINAFLIPDIENYKYYHNRQNSDGCEGLDCPEFLNKTFTIDEIKTEVLKTIIDKIIDVSKRLDVDCLRNLTIEIFLPLTLLNHNVEWWQIKEDLGFGFLTFIGKDYKVVVRSYERCTKHYERLRVNWKKKWETLETKIQQTCQSSIDLECDDETVNNLINSEQEIIGIKILKAPEKIGEKSIFAAILKTAIPVALWLRNNPPGLDCHSEIEEILGNCCLEELPDTITKKRNIADPDKEIHIGRHISLLWEDPYRLPIDIDYSM